MPKCRKKRILSQTTLYLSINYQREYDVVVHSSVLKEYFSIFTITMIINFLELYVLKCWHANFNYFPVFTSSDLCHIRVFCYILLASRIFWKTTNKIRWIAIHTKKVLQILFWEKENVCLIAKCSGFIYHICFYRR